MKVLIIGADSRSLIFFRKDLMQAMISHGHDVHVIGPPPSDRGNGFDLEKIGVTFHEVNFSRTGLNPFKDIATLFQIKKIIKSINVDLVFSFMIKPVIYGSLAAKLAGVKYIYSLIPGLGFAFMTKGLKGGLVRFVASALYKFSLSFNKKVFFQNNDDKNLFVNDKILKENKIAVANGSGVNTSVYSRESNEVEKITFLLAARVIRDKGIIEYLEASKILKQKYADKFVCLLAGNFDKNPTSLNQNDLEPYIKENIVEFLGDQPDMVKVYNKASVYVLPSYREGTPRSTLEAMSMKMPVVTTDVPGCRETVEEGVNGYMVPMKSIKELAEAMEKFLLNPELIHSMGENSYNIVMEKFEISKVNTFYLKELGLWNEKNI